MLESRVLEVFVQSGLNRQEFAQQLGISNAVLSHISSGRNKASIDLVINILKLFPEISPDWLLFGTEPMKRNEMNGIPEELIDDFLIYLEKIKQSELHTLREISNLEAELKLIKEKAFKPKKG